MCRLPITGFQHFKRQYIIFFQETLRMWLPRHSPVITLHALHRSWKFCARLYSKSLLCQLPEGDNNLRRKKKSFLKNVRKSLVWYDPAGFFHQLRYMQRSWHIIIMPCANFCMWPMNSRTQLVKNVRVLTNHRRKSLSLSATCIAPTWNYFLHQSLWTAMRHHLA